jgi:hypothetical protein
LARHTYGQECNYLFARRNKEGSCTVLISLNYLAPQRRIGDREHTGVLPGWEGARRLDPVAAHLGLGEQRRNPQAFLT